MKDQSIPPAQIDGGYEFNGWYCYSADYRPPPAKSWWWVHDDQYLVAAGPVEGYETVREFGYSRWLPPRRARILLLRRLPGGGREKGRHSYSEHGDSELKALSRGAADCFHRAQRFHEMGGS